MQPDYIKNELQQATINISQVIEIIYKIKSIQTYIPTQKDMQKFTELQATLKRIYEDSEYIITCMQRRMRGQHEHDYLVELAKKAGLYK